MENFKTQKETYYLDNIIIVPREVVFIVIIRKYNVVLNKIEHKYSPKALTSVIFSVRSSRVSVRSSTYRVQEFSVLSSGVHSGVHTSYRIYENMVGTLTDLSNIFSSSEPVSFSLVNTIRVKYL